MMKRPSLDKRKSAAASSGGGNKQSALGDGKRPRQRRRLNPEMRSKAKSKSEFKSMTAAALRLTNLGQRQLLEGEDADSYDELLARIRASVNPIDAIDDMFVADVVALEWEILRWRRLQFSLLQAATLRELETFLRENLPYEQYSDRLQDNLTEALEPQIAEDEDARKLARAYLQNEWDGIASNGILMSQGRLNEENQAARSQRAQELLQEYARGQPASVALIRDLLASAGRNIHAVVADALVRKLEFVERIDRLATIAESRRNAALREIDRRHAVLGERLRQTVQEIEEGQFEVIKPTPDEGKSAA